MVSMGFSMGFPGCSMVSMGFSMGFPGCSMVSMGFSMGFPGCSMVSIGFSMGFPGCSMVLYGFISALWFFYDKRLRCFLSCLSNVLRGFDVFSRVFYGLFSGFSGVYLVFQPALSYVLLDGWELALHDSLCLRGLSQVFDWVQY